MKIKAKRLFDMRLKTPLRFLIARAAKRRSQGSVSLVNKEASAPCSFSPGGITALSPLINGGRDVKSHPDFERQREAKSISRMFVAIVMIAVATSAWGCSSRVDPSGDWDSSTYASFRYLPGNISDTSPPFYLSDPAVARSGYTDPSWERAELLPQRSGEPLVPATNDRVLEIPQMLVRDSTAAATPISGDGN